ncbi:MAG: hypothetical protein LLG20_18600 [Acidobacteriales bacterium]|nr:hypothetical protein [Terriglobales bacterium]
MWGGRTADIVAVQNRHVWVIECKLQFGVDVIEQALRWMHDAHWVSVAVPKPRRGTYTRPGYKRSWLLERLCRDHGVGIIQVARDYQWECPTVDEDLDAHINRHAEANRILEVLSPEHQTFAPAGSAEGHKWTPFQRTCAELRRVVAEHPGIPVKEAIALLRESHYANTSSARACLTHWAEQGKIRGVCLRRDGRKLSFVSLPGDSGTIGSLATLPQSQMQHAEDTIPSPVSEAVGSQDSLPEKQRPAAGNGLRK